MATTTVTTGTLEGRDAEAVGRRARFGLRRAMRVVLALGAILASGCAARSQDLGASPPGYPVVDVGVAPSSPPPATAAEAAPPPPPSAAASLGRDSSAERSAGAPAQSRPGLGTEWGEERVSPTHDVAFERADASRPFAATELRYNDERGVAVLASHLPDRRHRGHETRAAGGAVSIWLQDGHDNPLDIVEAAGRTFVIGEAGERYTIVLENHTGHRVEAVTTVDGLDVITGKPGSVKGRGYLLMPHATLEIDGFRESEQTVAAFRFGRVADSYAAKVGTARNVGVIGVAFFAERGDRWTPWADEEEARRRENASPFPADPGDRGRFAQPPGR